MKIAIGIILLMIPFGAITAMMISSIGIFETIKCWLVTLALTACIGIAAFLFATNVNKKNTMKYIKVKDNEITLKSIDGVGENHDAERILSIEKNGDKLLLFENCDQFYCQEYTKIEMLEMLNELTKAIKEL